MSTSAHTTHSLDELIGRQLPAWMAGARPEQLAGLRAAMLAAAASHARAQQMLGALQSPLAFAEARLSRALQQATGVPVAVRRNRLIRSWQTVEGLPTGTLSARWRIHRLEQSLLEAALHNFDPTEAIAAGATGSLALFDHTNRSMALAPERFVQICRDLDLGGQYQAYLDSRFEPADTHARSALHALLEQVQREDLAVAMQRARIAGDIGAEDFRHLQQIVAAQLRGAGADQQVRCRQLSVLGRPLMGVVVFEVRSSAAAVEAVIAYLPGDALAPLKRYASWAALYQDLGGRFRDPQFVAQVQGYIGERGGRVFAANLARQLTAAAANAVIALDGRDSALDGPLFATLYRQRIALLKDNARLLAVPTGDEDFAARSRRLQGYMNAGINLLNLASLFVPGLGVLMLGVATLQIACEVYHGIEDWQQGDREGAINHLLGVAENVAAMALIGAGGAATVSLLRRSGFVDALVPVQLSTGRARLMSADLSGYRLDDSTLTSGQLVQGDTGVQLRLHDGTYALSRDESRDAWRIRHPWRTDAHAPLLQSNGAGGWQHPLDPPQFWQGAGLLVRRLGVDTADVSEEMAQRLLAVTGFDEARLRRLHVEGRPAPGRLLEALQRFELDVQFDELSQLIAQEQPLPATLLRLQLDMVTALPGWPRSIGLRVTLPDGGEWAVAAPDAEVVQTVQLAADSLRANDWLEVLLDRLADSDPRAWLGQPRALAEVNLQQVRRLLGCELRERRAALFEHAWRQRQSSELPQVTLLRRDFAGLSAAVAQEILEQTPSAQVARSLSSQRVPLEVAERARWGLRESRLDRANAGFFRAGMLSVDSETLALRLLDELAPWPADVRLELRRVGAEAGLLCAVGSTRAVRTVRVLKTPRGYRRDSADAVDAADLFEVLAPLLDDNQRALLAVNDSRGTSLRQVLGSFATADRSRAARLLGQAPNGFRPPQRLGDGRLGYPLSGGRANPQRTTIDRALRELYPTFSDEQASDYLNEVRASGQDVWAHVFDRQQQLAHLDTALNAWVAEPRSSAPRLAVGRRRAAWLIRNCWRRRALLLSGRDAGYRLRIDEEPLGRLPSLHESVDFSHVSDLTLRALELTEVNQAFLARFAGVRWLSLSDNRLVEVPQVLTHLPRLRHLELANNQVVIDAAGNRALASLPLLEALHLERNPLGPLLDLTPMSRLQLLGLRATQLTSLPRGLLSRGALMAADLRDNRLETLPVEAFADRHGVLLRLDLDGNPLMPATRARLVEFAHGARLPSQAGPAAGAAGRARQVWLSRPAADSEGWHAREARWARLEAEPASEDFFQLLADLAETADFALRRSELERRLWAVVDACEQSTQVRRELFELASRPRTCGDSVALHFSFLEVRMLVLGATRELPDTMVEPALLRLGRSLFRLDEVDRIAAEDIAMRQAQGVSYDEIEVRLAYRVGLAKSLGLPGQPLDMRFEQLANVDSRQLLNARGRVLAAEQTQRMLQTLGEREFWVEHLLATRAAEFERSEQVFFDRLDALTAREQTMSDGEYLHQANAIGAERAMARQGLIDRLTLAAWQRFTGQGGRASE
ncbi:hypothetical protein DCO48_17240 [Pseudomonas sp. SDI]|uniref:NEL-type E3 ubiquitin ligase domain-containing protein n=1 Tax=Pseudomonas sp. SDI TaxID=2170734 RepID=UPI000DE760DD|nr:NEL-type E3 ubiquitin ligase domain-containing protein [Pseudomonas sp. SDI]PWB31405.1 hypothetical protein DCO48_17240 [Pseudomonas sp. SDI]